VAQEFAALRERSSYAAAGELVFCHPESGHPLDRSKLVRRLKEAIARADVPPITFHELRHTFGTRMAAARVPLRTIQQWMGHSDAKATQIYAHHQPSEHEAELVERAFASGVMDDLVAERGPVSRCNTMFNTLSRDV
jgi:integrase